MGAEMFVPENEMGVVALFCMTCANNGWRVIRIGQAFPDVLLEQVSTGEQYWAEFELNASHFKAHQHDPRKCDLIICYTNDWPDCMLPILALPYWHSFQMYRVSDVEKENMHLRLENERLKRQLRTAQNQVHEKVKKKKTNYQLTPPPGPGWRIEKNKNRYFLWRRGSGDKRESVYGGPIELLHKVHNNG